MATPLNFDPTKIPGATDPGSMTYVPGLKPSGPTPITQPPAGGVPGPTDQGGGQIMPMQPAFDPNKPPTPAGGISAAGAPITDVNSLGSQITPTNTLANQRIGYGVQTPLTSASYQTPQAQAQATSGSITDAFNAMLPQLNQQFQQKVQDLTAQTAAMGRTGSGLFNRATSELGNQELANREALLGNLIFNSTQNDASRALQASLGNQNAGVSIAGINSTNAINNANRDLTVQQGAQQTLAQQQANEEALAQQATNDQLTRLNLLQLGYNYDPNGAITGAANTLLGASNDFGANAGTINGQLTNYLNQAQGSGAVSQPAQVAAAPAPQVPSSSLPQMPNVPITVQMPNNTGTTIPSGPSITNY